MKKLILNSAIIGIMLITGHVSAITPYKFNKTEITGAAQAETRELSAFDKIDISGAFTITLVQSNAENITMDVAPDIASKIITKVEKGTLKIYTEKDFDPDAKIALTVNFKNIISIDCSGANVINSSGALKFTNLSFDASGACKANLEFSATNLDIDMSGAVNATMKGSASKVDLDISGAGKLSAADLVASDYDVDISGTGNAEINASNTLNVEVSGTGNVKYRGQPKVTKDVSGTGNVSPLK